MQAVDPDQKPTRSDRRVCPACEATSAGCRSREWLSGRRCCEACRPAGHDAT